MEYNGWTLYDEITLVIKTNNHYSYNLPQAYVVSPNDKKQLERAIGWGTDNVCVYDEDNKVVRDSKGNRKVNKMEPNVVTLKNEGFEITLLDFAHNSSQGGKLSFWNCIIENKKHNIKCVVGISADILLTLLIQNKFNYGKCEKPVCFARQSGNVGVLTTDMVEYQEALKDMQLKQDIRKGTTSKWKVGCNYKTLTLDDMYFGDIYKLVNTASNPNRKFSNYQYSNIPSYIVCKQIVRNNIISKTSNIPEYIHTSSELETYLINTCNSNIDEIHRKFKDKHNNKYLNNLLYKMAPVFTRCMYGKYVESNKLPSRQQGNRIIEQDKSFEDVFYTVIKHTQQRALELFEQYEIDDAVHFICDLLVRTKRFSDDLSDLDELEIRLLKYLIVYANKSNYYTVDSNLVDLVTKLK